MWRSLVVAVVLAQAASLQAEDLGIARAALARYEAQVTSLEGTFIHEPVTPPPEGDNTFQEWRTTCHFTVNLASGSLRVERIRTWKSYGISRTKPFELREVEAWSGDSSCRLMYTFSKVPIPTDLPADVPHTLTRGYPATFASSVPWQIGPWKFHRPSSVSDLLGRGDATFDGIESVNGHACWRVKVEEAEQTLWLDPEVGFLPRRREYRSRGLVNREETVVEFQDFPDLVHKVQRAFPTHVLVRDGSPEERFRVTKLVLNPSVEPKRYQIDEAKLPPGVCIREPLGGPSYTGDRKDLYDERARLKEATDRKLEEMLPVQKVARATPPPPRPKEPEPDPWDNARLWAVGLAALVLLVVAVNRRRKA